MHSTGTHTALAPDDSTPSFIQLADEVSTDLWLPGQLQTPPSKEPHVVSSPAPSHSIHWPASMKIIPGVKAVLKRSREVWRVMLMDGNTVTVMNAVRSCSRGSWHRRHISEVVRLIPQNIQVYHPSLVPSITAKGEKLCRPGAVIASINSH